MFKKLLKYDMKAVSKLWWIGAVTSLAAATVGALLIKFFVYYAENDSTNVFIGLISIFGFFLALFCILAVIISFVFTQVLVFARFYKHFFTDEGYLTFTLPVKRSALLLSKTVNAAIYISAHTIVLVISFFLFFTLTVPSQQTGAFLNLEIIKVLGESITTLWSNIGAWLIVYVLEAILIAFVYLLFSILLVHFCITLGCTLIKKARLLVSIGIYYAISSVLSALWQFSSHFFVSLIFDGMPILMENATKNQTFAAYALLALLILSMLSAISAILYSITQYMLDRRLNLA